MKDLIETGDCCLKDVSFVVSESSIDSFSYMLTDPRHYVNTIWETFIYFHNFIGNIFQTEDFSANMTMRYTSYNAIQLTIFFTLIYDLKDMHIFQFFHSDILWSQDHPSLIFWLVNFSKSRTMMHYMDFNDNIFNIKTLNLPSPNALNISNENSVCNITYLDFPSCG